MKLLRFNLGLPGLFLIAIGGRVTLEFSDPLLENRLIVGRRALNRALVIPARIVGGMKQ